MLLKIVLIFCTQYDFVFPLFHEKPIAQSVWTERCSRGQRVLNDCNWCVCNTASNQFTCTARVCQGVDMFGHFNDAIREYVVGMEGHGAWRSERTPCTPRTRYRRGGLLCVCGDDGHWPSPVCRDLFRALHEVELTGHSRPSALHECTPSKLYLYGCSVCLCPPEGRIDPHSCTTTNCSRDDPILRPPQEIKKEADKYDLTEIYADCELDRKYSVGCKKCVCLKNNRLLCDNCESEVFRTGQDDYCARVEVHQTFNIDCNMCLCDDRGIMYCTTRRCLNDTPRPLNDLTKSTELTLRTVQPPIDSLECKPGTKYYQDCNTCFCSETSDGVKSLSCTLMDCFNRQLREPLAAIKFDCVENSVYEVDCLVCRCDVVDGVKRESCLVDSKCSKKERSQKMRSDDLDSLHGYCEPAHVYRKGCNTCRCLSDGKVAGCTARLCPGPVTALVVPVSQRGPQPCPPDHMYKVDCNYCFCLKNGNLLCTTADCDDGYTE